MKSIGLFLVLMLVLTGCSINSSKESLTFPIVVQGKQVVIEYKSEVWQGLFLYFTKTKGVEHITPLSSTIVGELESRPDSKSIEALSPFWQALLKGI